MVLEGSRGQTCGTPGRDDMCFWESTIEPRPGGMPALPPESPIEPKGHIPGAPEPGGMLCGIGAC
jgi:hypothetical protein